MISLSVSRMALSTATKAYPLVKSRLLTTQSLAAIQKLRGALEDYRLQNYSDELPTRVKKAVVGAAKHDETGQIAVVDMERVLANIHMEDRVSHSEMETIFKEMGGERHEISMDKLIKML